MADLWTAEDVERGARAIAKTRTDCDPARPCEACRRSSAAHLAALAEAGRLLPAGTESKTFLRLRDEFVEWYRDGGLADDAEPVLWQYGMPDEDAGPGVVMEFDGQPRVLTPRMVRRPMRAVGPWLPVPAPNLLPATPNLAATPGLPVQPEPDDPPFCGRCGHACAHYPRHILLEKDGEFICEDERACAARLCSDCAQRPGSNANSGCEACAEHVEEGP